MSGGGRNSKDRAELESGIKIEADKVAIEDSEDVPKGGTWDSLNGFWDFHGQKNLQIRNAGHISKRELVSTLNAEEDLLILNLELI